MKAPNPVNMLSIPSHVSLCSPLNLEVAELNRSDVSDAKAPIFSPIMAAMVLTVEVNVLYKAAFSFSFSTMIAIPLERCRPILFCCVIVCMVLIEVSPECVKFRT